MGVIVITQQAGFFLAQSQDLLHQRGVVEVLGIFRRLVRGAGHIGFVELLSQSAAFGKLHHGQVNRHLERQAVAFFPFLLGCVARGLHHIGGHAFELVFAHVQRKFVCRVQSVFAEFLRDFGQSLLDGGITFFGRPLQLGPAQNKAAQGVFASLGLLGVEAGGVDGFVFGIQAFVAAQTCPELGDAGQGRVVGGTQLWGVGHAVEVRDRAPGHAQPLGADIQSAGDGFPVRWKVCCSDFFKGLLSGCQQFVQSRRHMVWGNAVKQGQAGGVEQGVGHENSKIG